MIPEFEPATASQKKSTRKSPPPTAEPEPSEIATDPDRLQQAAPHETSSPSSDDVPLDLGPEPGGDLEAAGEPQGDVSGTGAQITVIHPVTGKPVAAFDIWRGTFAAAFRIGGQFSGLDTLRGAPDLGEFDPAARAIYDTVWDAPSFHWLLAPELKFGERGTAIFAFAAALYMGCRKELADRREPPPARSSPAKPAKVAAEDIPADPPPPPHEDMQEIRIGGGR